MALEPRQMRLLRALTRRDQSLQDEERGNWFMLMRVAGSGGRVALKPGIDGDERPTEADVLDFETQGLVHTVSSTSTSVVLKFALTADGRRLGSTPAVQADINRRNPDDPDQGRPAPTADAVLAELAALDSSPDGWRVLTAGGALVNELLGRHGSENLEVVARRVFELVADGLLAMDDVGAEIDQISDTDRLGMAASIRLTAAGRDRAAGPTQATSQLIQITQSQVALGNINNYTTFVELLDRADTELDRLQDVDEEARTDAKGLLARLRAGAGSAVPGMVGEAGGTLLGAVLKQLLGMS